MKEIEEAKLAQFRLNKINALKSYYLAIEQERFELELKSRELFESAMKNYIEVYNEGPLTIGEFDILISILKKLELTDSIAFFTLKRSEAIDKLDWERLNYLKNKFSDK